MEECVIIPSCQAKPETSCVRVTPPLTALSGSIKHSVTPALQTQKTRSSTGTLLLCHPNTLPNDRKQQSLGF